MKKILCLLMALTMTVGLTSCGGEGEKGESGEKGGNIHESKKEGNDNGYSENSKASEIIALGTYEQDNDTSNGTEAIEWRVIEKKDGKALVVSEYALDSKKYHEEYEDVTWETCTLRAWLNDEFLNEAFSEEERERILNEIIPADDNPEGEGKENDTEDYVFLLSVSEMEKYFDSEEEYDCEPTDYAYAEGAYRGSRNGSCTWWLRSSKNYKDTIYCISQYGGFGTCTTNCNNVAVRPAMWIELD